MAVDTPSSRRNPAQARDTPWTPTGQLLPPRARLVVAHDTVANHHEVGVCLASDTLGDCPTEWKPPYDRVADHDEVGIYVVDYPHNGMSKLSSGGMGHDAKAGGVEFLERLLEAVVDILGSVDHPLKLRRSLPPLDGESSFRNRSAGAYEEDPGAVANSQFSPALHGAATWMRPVGSDKDRSVHRLHLLTRVYHMVPEPDGTETAESSLAESLWRQEVVP